MDNQALKSIIDEIKNLDKKLEELGSVKKNIDSDISSLKSKKEEFRLCVENYMKDSSKSFMSMPDGTEISIRNSPKTFNWSDDNQMIEFLKSIGKFDEICAVETVINKKKLKSFLDELSDCDGLPSFVESLQDKVLQIRGPVLVKNDAPSKPHKATKANGSNIEDFDESQLDGL